MTLLARHGILAAFLAGVLLAACGGEPATTDPVSVSTPTATAIASPPPAASPARGTATPGTATGVAADPPDVDAVHEHIRHLVVDIGPRFAGTEEERTAANYVADVLREAGYDVALEEFPVTFRLDESTVMLPGNVRIDARALTGAAQGEASGELAWGGLGGTQEIGADASGKVVLLERGVLTFGEKAQNAARAGAAAVVIVNNEPGLFQGTLGNLTVSIPVLAVAREDRAALEAALGETVTAQANATVREERSQNVVAREGERCRLILGAHYDSVTAGPGANDNASGTATMLELARVHRTDGLCAIAFGAEEIGLFGSRAYVQQSDLAGLVYVLNFDMTGKLTGGTIVGTQTLQQKVLDLLRAEGEFPLRAGSFGARTSSDHASFIDAGIPAVTFNSGNDEFIHTEHDDMDNVDRDSLRTMLAAGDVAVRGLLEEIGAPVR